MQVVAGGELDDSEYSQNQCRGAFDLHTASATTMGPLVLSISKRAVTERFLLYYSTSPFYIFYHSVKKPILPPKLMIQMVSKMVYFSED